MLHQIELPTYDGKLDQIVEFQRKFIAFLCAPNMSLSPREDDFKQAFADDQIGTWTFTWLQKKKKNGKGTYYEDLSKLLAYLDTHQALRQQIIDAFNNDTDFYSHKDDSQFTFLYNTHLSLTKYKDLRRIIVSLMVVFYDELFSDGFPPYIAAIDRKMFLQTFWNTNKTLGVCPACDAPRPDINELYYHCDVDHFLPKSLYPFLSMRATNLVPLCTDCNRWVKRNKDPLDQSLPDPLLNTFYPYGRPAINEIKVVVYRETNGERKVRLEERCGGTSKRIELLNNVFDLEVRWNERLKQRIGSIERKLKRSTRDRRKKDWSATDIVESFFETETSDEDIRRDPYSVIMISYIDYAVHNSEERLTLEELVSEEYIKRG